MLEWWTELALPLQVFYAIAWLSLVVTVLQTMLALLGLGVEGLAGAFDVDIGGDSSGLGLFSSHTVSAFFLGFGWGGVIGLKAGWSVIAATALGTGGGSVLMFAMFFMLKGLLKLQSSGNLDYSKAVGTEATVYVTIPGDNHDGGGQVQVMLQGRLITAAARRVGSGAIAPGERVRITGMNGQTSFLVEPLSSPEPSN